MTSFNKSAQLSLGPVALGVFVNHNVQVCMSGCLMLKFLGSWKTVKGSCWGTMVLGAEEDVGDEVEGEGWDSRESLSIDSVGRTGETTSVMIEERLV